MVEYDPEHKRVRWVSSDYVVYANPAADFDIPRFRLGALARWRIDPGLLQSYSEAVTEPACPGVRDAEELQRQINAAAQSCGAPLTIELGPGSEVTNLASNVDVRVKWESFRWRSFTLLSQAHVARLFSSPADSISPGIYATGWALIIVRQLNGSSIVRGVLRYLMLEQGSA